jgi:hypothetical protein
MQVIIDERIDKNIEKYFLDLGYDIIKIKKHDKIYDEISSHTDIFCTKIDDILICEKETILDGISDKYKCVYGNIIEEIYPKCATYNICIIDDFAVHNFKITDKVVLNNLIEKNYKLINVKQGYSRCSILPLNNKCCVTSDKGIYQELKKSNFDVLYLSQSDLDIKLFKSDGIYSDMSGFIGGCSAVLGDSVIFFGDIDRFKCKDKLVEYIHSKGFKIKDFKNMDVIDYGSCIFLE